MNSSRQITAATQSRLAIGFGRPTRGMTGTVWRRARLLAPALIVMGLGLSVGAQSALALNSPTLTTIAPSTVAAGTPYTVNAVLAGSSSNPASMGVIGVKFFTGSGCSGAPSDTTTVVVNGDGTYSPGSVFGTDGTLPPGTYSWSSFYGGDSNNNSAASNCANVTVTCSQPALIYPTNGQTGVDGSTPFSWCPVAGARYYYLTVGSSPGGYDVVNSGNLPGTQTSFNTGRLPAGATLYARIWAYVNGGWVTQDISFTTPAVQAGMFTSPTNGQTGVTAPRLFTWTASPQAQYYYLTVGTQPAGYDVVNSGNLPSTQTSYNVTSLPAGTTLYARLYSYINGGWVTQDIAFST